VENEDALKAPNHAVSSTSGISWLIKYIDYTHRFDPKVITTQGANLYTITREALSSLRHLRRSGNGAGALILAQ